MSLVMKIGTCKYDVTDVFYNENYYWGCIKERDYKCDTADTPFIFEGQL